MFKYLLSYGENERQGELMMVPFEWVSVTLWVLKINAMSISAETWKRNQLTPYGSESGNPIH